MLPQNVRERMQAIVGDKWFKDDTETLVSYSYDATPLYQSMPEGVVFPASTEEVSGIMKICAEYKIPVIGRGAGSNLCAGVVPVLGGLVIVMTRMNRLLEIDQDNLTATFQTGLNTKQFHTAVEQTGLFYPPDPGSMIICTMGGNIALGAGGLRGLKYGTTKDYVIGLEAVLANGDILRTGGKLVKDVAGYDLTKLLVGSGGTLAILTEATVKLVPKPVFRRSMLAIYSDLSAAARSVSQIIANRITPCTLEFMDKATIRVVEDFARIGLPVDAEAVLAIEQDGDETIVERDLLLIEEICRREGAIEVKVAATPEEGAKVMEARRSALAALSRLRPTTILEDATVPRSKLAEMVQEVQRVAAKFDVQICTFGHAGDGNLHPTAMTDARNPEELHRVEQAFDEIFEVALSLGGTITGEHGVGLVKAPYLEWKVGASGIDIMKRLKLAFDPDNIMNPGKMFAETRKRVVLNRPHGGSNSNTQAPEQQQQQQQQQQLDDKKASREGQ
ncbi:FAD-linked oxidase C-terminal domain-containing protein [Paenibacillus radicis (ex Xue et al. 2023)]|uniref:FAD-binding protein n=1 Tax=Paenibacillus radicis (ex Xue et al. 2023) TaxID=2972489 RepID=A0ABT1Y8Z6_9BACL|nr:FAD-linked oxidase C-terminal domain-containing protein [Paenibacillus radicis (ex Xue et al. 2023)]MCR8629663.1 FAD-binding protein [Paenibacillus radicis (ex Xue et al. 2023)]